MTTRMLTPVLNLPTRKQKGLIKLFGGLAVPFYYTTDAVPEGAPMKFGATANLLRVCAAGAPPVGDGVLCIGLALQSTYDEATFDPQLKGYHFANDTRQRLDGSPIGLLTGKGWALTTNYAGQVAAGDIAAIDPTPGVVGRLVASAAPTPEGDKLPVVFEEAKTAPAPVRIRFEFNLASQPRPTNPG